MFCFALLSQALQDFKALARVQQHVMLVSSRGERPVLARQQALSLCRPILPNFSIDSFPSSLEMIASYAARSALVSALLRSAPCSCSR